MVAREVEWEQRAGSVRSEEARAARVIFGVVFPTKRFGMGLLGANFRRSKGPDEIYCIENNTYNYKNIGKPFRGWQLGKEIQICEFVVECFFFTYCHQLCKEL